MVRQAHTYLLGAMSAATLVAIAIAVFVLLVSAQVFGDWPIAGLGGSQETAVQENKPVDGAGSGAAAPGADTAKGASANAAAGGGKGGATATSGNELRGGSTTGSQAASDPVTGGGGGGGQGGAGGAPSNPGSGGGSPTAGGGSTGGGGSGAGGSSSTASSPSQTVTDTVNDTVTKVDQTVTGGALEATGVTTTTEEVVNGVLGPESAVGKTVDGVAGTVGGLLSPKP